MRALLILLGWLLFTAIACNYLSSCKKEKVTTEICMVVGEHIEPVPGDYRLTGKEANGTIHTVQVSYEDWIDYTDGEMYCWEQ